MSAFSLYGQQTITGTLMHDGIQRNYRLYIPSGYSAGTAVPLVFNLHGYTSNAFQQQFYSAMDVEAEQHNFLVCYPNGVGEAWNVDWNFGSTADDVGFISALIDELAASYTVNLSRVYSCGMSNGGFMSYRLACELNDRIAAIASVTGSMTPGYVCEPGQPVPVLEIHGTADAVVPYNGLAGLSTNIDQVISFWVDNNNCVPDPDTTEIENTNLLDLCTAIRVDYNDCDDSRVLLIKVEGGGHTWPGTSIIVGVTNQDFNASEEIWEFFSQFELGGVINDLPLVEANQRLAIFPNPASEVLHLQAGSEGSTFHIFDSVGREIMRGKMNGPSHTIQLADWQAGIYYLTVVSGEQRFSRLFVKK